MGRGAARRFRTYRASKSRVARGGNASVCDGVLDYVMARAARALRRWLVLAAFIGVVLPTAAHAKGLPDRVTFSGPGADEVPLLDWSAFDYWGHFVDSPANPIQPPASLPGESYVFTWEYVPLGNLVMRYYPAAERGVGIVDIEFVGGLERWYVCSTYGEAVFGDIIAAPGIAAEGAERGEVFEPLAAAPDRLAGVVGSTY
jgi:hypothetical protein